MPRTDTITEIDDMYQWLNDDEDVLRHEAAARPSDRADPSDQPDQPQRRWRPGRATLAGSVLAATAAAALILLRRRRR